LQVVSVYTPKKDSSGSTADPTWDIYELPPQDPSLLNKYFLVEGEELLQLFHFCPKCGHKIPEGNTVRLLESGTAPVVQYLCKVCSLRGLPVKRWEGQKRAVDHSSEKTFRGNLVAAVAAITTGLRYVDLQRWAKQLGLALFSKTTFWKYFEWTMAAVDKVYAAHQAKVVEKVRGFNEDGQGLHLAADGSYDSRGYSALIGKVVLCDLRTKLVLHTEVLHRSETGNVSGRMEVEGTRRLLRWVLQQGMPVRSLTTDRSRTIGALLAELREELGPISHYYDGWHMVKWVGNRLREESKASGCAPIAVWTEKVKTHLWKSIEVGAGNGDMVRHVFNTCLMHVKGVHQWSPTPETGPYTSCGHLPVGGPRPETLSEGTKAFTRFRDIVLNRRLQEDLVKASPYGGTSVCEAKNALDRLYCRKEIFYPITTYPFYAKMATMHFNTLRLSELAGERKVERVIEVKRKYLSRTSRMTFKTSVHQVWRDDVLDAVLRWSMESLQRDRNAGQMDETSIRGDVAGAMEAEDIYDQLNSEVLQVEDLWQDLANGLELDSLEGPEYSDVSAVLQIAYAMVNDGSRGPESGDISLR
ncbi:hypothetical protein ANCCAN_21906, partial [Ancylostoma caninum]